MIKEFLKLKKIYFINFPIKIIVINLSKGYNVP